MEITVCNLGGQRIDENISRTLLLSACEMYRNKMDSIFIDDQFLKGEISSDFQTVFIAVDFRGVVFRANFVSYIGETRLIFFVDPTILKEGNSSNISLHLPDWQRAEEAILN